MWLSGAEGTAKARALRQALAWHVQERAKSEQEGKS